MPADGATPQQQGIGGTAPGQPPPGFADLLRRLRLEARLTQEELAERAAVSLRTVQDLEERRHRTSHKATAEKLANALNVTGQARVLFVQAATGRIPAADALAVVLVAGPPAAPEPFDGTVSGSPVPAAVPRELPADVGAFTGRAAELAELDALLLPDPRLGPAPGPVVISAVSGTAGAGKTALAVHWAHRVAERFPDGQLYVNLRGYDPEQPLTATQALAGFLNALGAAGPGLPPDEGAMAARYRSLLAGKRLLVVLDNAATEEQVRPLLPGSPSVLMIVTSRDTLPGLVARDGARRLDLDLLPAEDAVALLGTLIGDRVTADPEAARTLAGLCARLPLALRVAAELAAAEPGRPLAALAAELADESARLELLDAGGDPRGAVASVLSWSYCRLAPGAAELFRLLGLHPGPDWDAHTAASLAGLDLRQARQLLAVLARAHLIQGAGPGRHGMHDLLRAYAADQAAAGDQGTTRRDALTRLFDYYLAACAAAMDALALSERHRRPAIGPVRTPVPEFADRDAARTWLDAEMANLVAVAAHAADHGWPRHAVGLAQTLHRYFDGVHDAPGLLICRHGLDAARQCDDRAAQARTLTTLGVIYGRRGQYDQAAQCHEEAIVLAREVGDRLTQGWALGNLGLIHDQQGRYRQAARCHRQTLAINRELGDVTGEAIALSNLGLICLRQCRYPQAASHMQQAIGLYRRAGHQFGEAIALTNLGEVRYRQGRYQQAAGYQVQARALAAEIGSRRVEAWALARLGKVRCREGQPGQAVGHYEQALEMFREVGDRDGEAEALNGTGETLLAAGRPEEASLVYDTALALTREAGDQHEQARALIGLGEVSHRQGRHAEAARYRDDALALYRKVGDPGGEAEALNGIGATLVATGQPGQALACHDTALTLAKRIGDRYQQARAHLCLADACDAAGQHEPALEHRRQALDICADLGIGSA